MHEVGIELGIENFKVACVGFTKGRLCLFFSDENNLRPAAICCQDLQARHTLYFYFKGLSSSDLKLLGGSCFGPMICHSRRFTQEAKQQMD